MSVAATGIETYPLSDTQPRSVVHMKRSELHGAIMVWVLLALSHPVLAQEDPLSDMDYRWLNDNLNVPRESLALQDLTTNQKSRVHAMINRKSSPDKRLNDVADYVYRINGEDFDNTLRRSEELIVVPLPSHD